MSTDLTPTLEAKSDQLNADDLVGKTLTIKITKVSVMVNEQPVTINYEDDKGKPYKPGKSMRRVLSRIWGSEGKVYVGRTLVLYCDPTIKFGGLEVGGIRISHMSHLDKKTTINLAVAKASKKPFTVLPLSDKGKADPETDKLKAEGSTAAGSGVAAYTAWKDALSPEQKDKIKPFHSGWSKEAVAFDAKSSPSSETPPKSEERSEEPAFDDDEAPV